MPIRKRNPTRADKQRDREAAMMLAAQGHTQAEIAKTLQLPLSTIKFWSRREDWRATLGRVESLANHRAKPSTFTVRKVAFDLTRSGKKSRNLLARTVLRTARYTAEVAKTQPEVIFENAGQLAALTKATAQIHNWDSETPQNRFSVDVKIGAIASKAGEVRELSDQEIMEIESEASDS